MTLNLECVRDLILWIEKNQTVKASGIPSIIKMKSIYSAFYSSKYTVEDLNTAAQYLVDEKLLKLPKGVKADDRAPKGFVFCGITSTGYKYIEAIKDETVWNKIKSALGSASLASVPTVIETAAKFLL